MQGKVDDAEYILQEIQSVKGMSEKKLKTKLELPTELVNHHLNTLISKNLVELVEGKNRKEQIIKITDKGAKFLELYDAIRLKYLTRIPSDDNLSFFD